MAWKSTENHWTKKPNAHEIIEKLIKKRSIKGHPKPWLGRKHTLQEKRKISRAKKSSLATVRGPRHHNWKGGVTRVHNKLRGSLEYVLWRDAVYRRDNWSCRLCEVKCQKGNIVAHHVQKFSDFPELRFIVENGLTLCRKCHIEIEHPLKRT